MLSPGSKLGSYEVLSLLGAGGMGEVYRARDTRLGRAVAIKVLPAERMADENRRRRFVQEARAASALNHPNIVTIHEIESADGIDFIVMEYVEGKTLDALIPRQGMKLGDVLRIAIPIADALGRAHAAGIVHRDLKPANVVVGSEGAVKVLDFGLAKLVTFEPGHPDHETVSEEGEAGPLSRSGMVVGTAGYMSPEQATGKDVDARSDVFSFGAVLYEMVTGQRAFAGNSTAETLAAVVRDQPRAPSEVVPSVPKELDRLIQRCLRKEPDRRFQHMADVKVELNEIKEESDSTPAPATTATRQSRLRLAMTAAGSVVLVAGVGVALWRLRPGEVPSPRLVNLVSSRRVDSGAFSPDGTQLAYSSPGERGNNFDIWLKIVGEEESRRVTTDPLPDVAPVWAPDGKRLAFLRLKPRTANGSLYLVSPIGGSERKLLDSHIWGQLDWSPDGRWIALARARQEGETSPESGGIQLISSEGGQPRPVTSPQPPTFDIHPAFSPDGHDLAYGSCQNRAGEMLACDVYVLPLDGESRPRGTARRLSQQGLWLSGLVWTRDGRSIVYSAFGGSDSKVWRLRADGTTPPERVELAGSGNSPFIAKSRDRLGFGRSRTDIDIYRVRQGEAPTPLIASTAWDLLPQYSPDGRRIAFTSFGGAETSVAGTWLADADGSNPTRLTNGGSPNWSPDGRSIAVDGATEDGHWYIWTIGVDGAS